MRPLNARSPTYPRLSAAPAGRSRTLSLLVAFLTAYASAGCKCEREERKPYTPFGVASSLRAPEAAPVATATDSGTPGARLFDGREATLHSPPAEKLTAGSVTFVAPAGRAFTHSVMADLGKNGDQALVGWLTPKTPKSGAELWLIPAAGSPKKLVSQPGFVPTREDCAPALSLKLSGPTTLTYSVRTTCQEPLADRVPSSAIGVVAPLESRPKLLQLRLAAPPSSVTVKTRVDSQDRDADGHDDVALRMTLKRKGSTLESSANVVWLSRSSGLSRQLEDTEKSFSDVGSVEVVRSRGRKTGARVRERLNGARALFSYLCKESGTFGVTLDDGDPLPCGNLGLARDFFSRAELSASLTLGDIASALGALRRSDWFAGKLSEKQRTALKKQLAKQLTSVTATSNDLKVRARGSAGAPRFSPLSFDSAGALLIQTSEGVTRYTDGELADATDEIDPWPLAPFGPRGERVLGATFPCGSFFVGITGSSSQGKVIDLLSTDWPSPRPGRCAGSGAFSAPEIRIIRWDDQGLSAQLDLSLVGPKRSAGAQGSPLSPDGKTRIAQTALGLIVQDATKTAHWKLDGSDAWSECVVGNDGLAAACLNKNTVVYITASQKAE